MTVRETIQRAAARLESAGIEFARLDAEWLLAHAMNARRMRMISEPSRVVDAGALSRFEELLARRERREPLQHILGTASFDGLELEVNGDVLIPRPETEQLAELAGEFLRARSATDAETLSVLDIGTGSGCLPIWIASKFPDARVMTVDISPEAIAVARRNAKQLGVSERIDILEGDCFAPLPAGATFDLIVSNPPYIPTAEIAALQPEVAVHDPVRALDGGADGLDFYRRFAAEASGRLRRDGKLMLEFGDGQGETLRSLFIEHKWIVEAVVPDYSRRDRFLIARREATE